MTAKVCFTMDNLGDAADLGRGVIDTPRSPGQQPALDLGLPAMLELYAHYEVAITYFIEGWSAEAHPDAIRHILDQGHTLGMHAWQHETWSDLSNQKAREVASRATEALAKAAGIRPRAFRAPGGKRTEATAQILLELGYEIDASLDPSGRDGGQIKPLLGNLWTVPYQWQHVDASHWLWHDRTAHQVEGIWRDSLQQCARENGFITFIWHPHIMGIDAARREVGQRILEYVHSDAAFRIVSLQQLVDTCRQ